jgi:hypothetical protein
MNPATPAGALALAHALVGIGFVAGLIGRWMVLAAAERAEGLAAIRTLTAVAAPFERLVRVSSLLLLVLGLATALVQGRPILGPLQGGTTDWLFVSLVLYVSIVPLVPIVFLPKGRVFEAALRDAEARGEVTRNLRQAVADPIVRAAHIYELGAATVILGLMFAKPF